MNDLRTADDVTGEPRIAFNLATLKEGGGQTVAMNLLTSLATGGYDFGDFRFVVAAGSEPQRYLAERCVGGVLVMPRNALLRMGMEMTLGSLWLRWNQVDVIYSVFGFGLFLTTRPQVCGSADSNLYYPEVDFWQDCGYLERMVRWLVDKYRVWGMHRAAMVVFENEDMMLRALQLFRYRACTYIRPSVTAKGYAEPAGLRRPGRALFRGLFLSGWQLNKNIMRIPAIAARLRERGIEADLILTAAPDGGPLHRRFMASVESEGVQDAVRVIGPVSRAELASLYSEVDAVFLLSRLESFSNTILEAWKFGRPLVVADEPWARSLCGGAALFVNRDSPDDIADAVVGLLHDEVMWAALVERGQAELTKYPTSPERVEQELKLVRTVVSAFGCRLTGRIRLRHSGTSEGGWSPPGGPSI